jgi:hypothetical protein
MNYTKKLLAAILSVAIIAAAVPLALHARADSDGVQKKLDELRAVYTDGTYFTADGKPCYANQSDNCRLSRIPSRGGLPSGAAVCGGNSVNESWSCRAFANYVFYYLFGERYWNLNSTGAPVLGDFIKLNGGSHSAIYLWEDADNYYVYDSNGDSCNGVSYGRAYSKKMWRLSGVYHAASYEIVKASGISHNFAEPKVKAATCKEAGARTFVCRDCGFTYQDVIPVQPHVYTVETVAPGEHTYGFTKYVCVTCGEILRKDVKDPLTADALVTAEGIRQTENGVVYISSKVTEEQLLDAFPGYDYSSEPASCTGVKLIPAGVDSVPENDLLTVILPGDLDGDGKVTATDARTLLRGFVNMEPITDEDALLAADLDFDGKVTAEDARWILRTSVGYETGATTLAGME